MFIVEHFDSLYDPFTKSHEKWFKKTLEAIKNHQKILSMKSSNFLNLFYNNVDILIQLFVNIFIEYNVLIQLINSLKATSYDNLMLKLQARTSLSNETETIRKNILEHQIQPFFIETFMTEEMRKMFKQMRKKPTILDVLTKENSDIYIKFKVELEQVVNMCFNLNDKFKKETLTENATPLYEFITRCKSKIKRIFKFNMEKRNKTIPLPQTKLEEEDINKKIEQLKKLVNNEQNKQKPTNNPLHNNGTLKNVKQPSKAPSKEIIQRAKRAKQKPKNTSRVFTNIRTANNPEKQSQNNGTHKGSKYGPVDGALYDSVSLRF